MQRWAAHQSVLNPASPKPRESAQAMRTNATSGSCLATLALSPTKTSKPKDSAKPDPRLRCLSTALGAAFHDPTLKAQVSEPALTAGALQRGMQDESTFTLVSGNRQGTQATGNGKLRTRRRKLAGKKIKRENGNKEVPSEARGGRNLPAVCCCECGNALSPRTLGSQPAHSSDLLRPGGGQSCTLSSRVPRS